MDFDSDSDLPVAATHATFDNLLDDDFGATLFPDPSSSQFSFTSTGEIMETQIPPSGQHENQYSDSDKATIYASKLKSRRSWVWKHGTVTNRANKTWWRCNLCPPRTAKMYVDSSTHHPLNHLKLRHRMTEAGRLPALGQRSGLIQEAFGNTIPKIQFHNQVFRELH